MYDTRPAIERESRAILSISFSLSPVSLFLSLITHILVSTRWLCCVYLASTVSTYIFYRRLDDSMKCSHQNCGPRTSVCAYIINEPSVGWTKIVISVRIHENPLKTKKPYGRTSMYWKSQQQQHWKKRNRNVIHFTSVLCCVRRELPTAPHSAHQVKH